MMGRSFDERLSLLNRAVAIRELSIGRDKDQNAGHLGRALEKCAECYDEAGRLVEAESRWAKCSAAYTKVRLRFRSRAQFLGEILDREVAWWVLCFFSGEFRDHPLIPHFLHFPHFVSARRLGLLTSSRGGPLLAWRQSL